MRMIDLHCDTLWRLSRPDGLWGHRGTLMENPYGVDVKRLEKADALVQVFAVFFMRQIRVDTHASTVQKDGSGVSLSSIEYRLLVVLMENPGRIVRRESLMERLWDAWGQEIEDNTLSVNISRLRRKIGSEYIETIRGFGYRFAKPVERCLG